MVYSPPLPSQQPVPTLAQVDSVELAADRARGNPLVPCQALPIAHVCTRSLCFFHGFVGTINLTPIRVAHRFHDVARPALFYRLFVPPTNGLHHHDRPGSRPAGAASVPSSLLLKLFITFSTSRTFYHRRRDLA